MSIPSPFSSPLHKTEIHSLLAILILAAAPLTIGCTLALVLSQYKRARRSLSTRQGAQRRRLVVLFLRLAIACFIVVTGLKYVDAGARAEVADTLAGGFDWDDDAESREQQ
jgi:hypothetical protein